MRAVAGLALLLIAARPAFALDCDLRHAKDRTAFAEVLVRVESAREDAQSSFGDHCDEQRVTARVVRPLSGPLKTGDPVAFSLTQGACNARSTEEHAFVEPGGEIVVLLGRDLAGGLYQVRTESAGAYEVAVKICSKGPDPR